MIYISRWLILGKIQSKNQQKDLLRLSVNQEMFLLPALPFHRGDQLEIEMHLTIRNQNRVMKHPVFAQVLSPRINLVEKKNISVIIASSV